MIMTADLHESLADFDGMMVLRKPNFMPVKSSGARDLCQRLSKCVSIDGFAVLLPFKFIS